MSRILCIDDEPINHELVGHALERLGCRMDYAETGRSGAAMARNLKPDMIITDVMMPELNGYDLTRQLRRENEFAATPILVLTGQAGLQDKLKAFEAGADDFLTKPFEAEELAARVSALLRRAELLKAAQPRPQVQQAHMIAVHSLRGGIGCSTLAVNLAVGLASLWPGSTSLIDLTMTAGQVALMLNMTLRRTWADLAGCPADEVDGDLINSITGTHDSGLQFVAAPTFPADADRLTAGTLEAALKQIKSQYSYVVADLPHDFGEPALQALDRADVILMVAAPDMASLRAVTAARETYTRLGYGPEKLKLILSATFPHSSLTKDKIESALGMQVTATIPYVQDVFVDAINLGQPPVYHKPALAVSGLLEDFAFYLSKETHKKTRPDAPSDAWQRVFKRHQERKR
ncbi:MAG: response regulator [Anaerolineae bacterium]